LIYLDAIVLKIRDGVHVRNKAAHIAVGVDIDGIKHVLGIWIENTEGAKFWAGVCAELANRGVQDVLIVCTDGLRGFPEAIEATWPDSLIQTCVVHLIRAAMRFVSYKDRKAVAAALKPLYTAATEEAALEALTELAASDLGKQYPHMIATWENAWDRFVPFLAFPPNAAPGDLHDERDRVAELPTAQDHEEPRPLPLRRRSPLSMAMKKSPLAAR